MLNATELSAISEKARASHKEELSRIIDVEFPAILKEAEEVILRAAGDGETNVDIPIYNYHGMEITNLIAQRLGRELAEAGFGSVTTLNTKNVAISISVRW
jgi:hypothetical protein